MGKFFNHYCPDRAVGFGHPYSDRRPETWHYTLGYRGYDLDVVRDVSLWQVGIHPRKPELPIIHRCEVRSHNQEEAVLEAKRRVDAILTLYEAPGLCIWRPHLLSRWKIAKLFPGRGYVIRQKGTPTEADAPGLKLNSSLSSSQRTYCPTFRQPPCNWLRSRRRQKRGRRS